MSALTPLAVLAVALGGALVVALLERAVAGPAVLAATPPAGAALLDQPVRRPASYDAWTFHLAPGLLLLAALGALAAVPWAPGFVGIDLEAGALLFAAALAYVTPAVFMAGWGAGRPLAVLAAFRFLALMLAYAMLISMVLTAVAAPAGSLRPADIVDAQDAIPFALSQPLVALLWPPAVMAVAFLAPFDVHVAPSELGGGAFGEYRGVEAAIVALARRVLLVAVAGMTAAMLLGGWHGPVLPGAVWMALKTVAVAALMLLAGRLVPRVETDRLLSLAWKVAIPLAILAIVYAGLLTLLFYR